MNRLLKRISLFVVTNLAVLLVLTIVVYLFGLNHLRGPAGRLSVPMLLGFSAVIGVGGALISLSLSRVIAKWATGARVIISPVDATEQWLISSVESLSRQARIAMPQVAVYPGAPNAFATGPSSNRALVAVSTGLLSSMQQDEIKAVLAHEVAHIANGDMVTLALVQGVVNTFVVFFARLIASVVDAVWRRGSNGRSESGGPIYWVVMLVLELLFGILASLVVMYVSRRREYRADAGSALLLGSPTPMVRALRTLGSLRSGLLPQTIRTFGIHSRPSHWASWFSSHPSIEARIAALATA